MARMLDTAEPVFVCGLGRSGTSWISKSLGQSHELFYVKETWLIAKFQDLVDWYSMLYDKWTGFTPWNEKGIDRKQFVEMLSRFYKDLLLKVSDGSRIIEKTPGLNVLHLKLLNELFPEAYYILIYRDGRNYVASLESKKAKQKEEFKFEKSCIRWATAMDIFEQIEQKNMIRNYRMIRYEDLLLNFDGIFTGLCSFVGIKAFKPDSFKPNSSFESFESSKDFNNRWKDWSEEKKNIFKKCAGAQLLKWRYEDSLDSW